MALKFEWYCVNEQNEIKPCLNPSVKSKHLSMHFFFVENESILIQTPNGNNILYDCGSERAAEDVHKKLLELKVNKLDVMVASHTHEDHARGFYHFWKLPHRKVKMGELYDNGEEGGISDKWFNEEYLKFKNNLPDGGKYHRVQGIKKLDLDPDLDIRLYVNCKWITNTEDYRKYRAVWMTIKYKNATILLEGDSKAAYENKMIRDFNSIDNAHILKLSEHGNKYSTKPNLLGRVKPVFAVVCNKTHHDLPDKDLMKSLSKSGIRIFNTLGSKRDIEFSTDGILKGGKISYKVTYGS